jgi:iron complex outermembrane receptor protein
LITHANENYYYLIKQEHLHGDHTLKHPIALALALSSITAAAQHNDPELEEILVTGSLSRYSALKSDTPIMETARSISIESQLEILDKGALSLDDTFTYTAGVTGETFGFATRGDWLKVRGLDVPQYQDSLQSLFGNYNNTRPDIYTLEQVEILKGPASVLYGKGSPGGLVNVVSKRPQDESRHEIVAEVGNFDRYQLAADSTGRLTDDGIWLYRVVAVYRDSDTQVDFVEDDSITFAPSVSWRPSERTEVTLLLNYTDTDSDTAAQFLPIAGTLEPGPDGRKIDSSTYTGEPGFNNYDAKTTAVTLLANHQFNDVWSMEFTSRYTDAEADYQQAWTSFIGDRYWYNPDGSLYKDGTIPRTFFRSDRTSEQAAFDVRLRANFDTGPLQHSVLMGAQYQDVKTGQGRYYQYAMGLATHPEFGDTYWLNIFDPVYGNSPPEDVLNADYVVSPDSETRDTGLYINDQISLGNWRFTLGLRWDETETDTGTDKQDDDAVSGAVGVLYQFDNGLAPYVSYAESFEPVIGDDGNGQALDPQEGEQTEIGIKYQPDNFPALITVAWFDIEQSNLPDPLSQPNEFQQQAGIAEVEGLELESIMHFGDFRWELNLSKLKTEDANGWRFASVPEKQASTWVTWRPQGDWSGFKAGAGVRYMGESWDGLDQLKTPSYTLGDLMLGWEFERWDIALNVRNLTDKDYYSTCLARGD